MPKVTIITAGSRGDVQPYLALAVALREAGHLVRLATHGIYSEWITSYGIEPYALTGNPRDLVEQGGAQDWLETGLNGFQFLRQWRQQMGVYLEQGMVDALGAAEGADILVASPLAYYAVHTVSQKSGQPWVQTFLQPIHPTTAYPSPILPTPFKLGGWYNYLTHILGGQFSWQLFRSAYNRVRRRHFGLKAYPFFGPFPAVERAKVPALYALSAHLAPPSPRWPDHLHVTGAWYLDEGQGWQPPVELAAFLAEGPPPVYVGFGSMSTRDPVATTRLVLDALAMAGQRGVLLTGWKGLERAGLSESVCVVEAAPHDWLFPRMAAVVHHGGAGTTAASLRAGVPTVVVPFFGDQPWWGDRIHAAGVGPAPIPIKQLTADKLAAALHLATGDGQMRLRAAALGELVRSEPGVQAAVAIIEAHLG